MVQDRIIKFNMLFLKKILHKSKETQNLKKNNARNGKYIEGHHLQN